MFARTLSFAVIVACFATRPLGASDPVSATPPPELQRLASSVGTWKTTQRFWISAGANAFESTSTENVRWSESQEFLISEQRGVAWDGPTSRLCITSWNPEDRQIHVLEVSRGGSTVDMTVWFEGDTQKVLSYRRWSERLVRVELTIELLSPDESKFHADCTHEEKTWVCLEGTSKRAQ